MKKADLPIPTDWSPPKYQFGSIEILLIIIEISTVLNPLLSV